MLSKLTALTTYGSTARSKARAFLNKNAHLTYTARVVLALLLGLFGLMSAYAFMGVERLGTFRTALVAAVAGTSVVSEQPIVLSGVSVQGEVVSARELTLSSRASGVIVVAPRAGDIVREGDIVARIENGSALRTVRSAEVTLASARLAADMNRRADALSRSSEASARMSASQELTQALATGRSEIEAVLPLMPDVLSGLSGMLYGAQFGDDENALMKHAGIIEPDNDAIRPFVERAGDGYVNAKQSYETAARLFHNEAAVSDEVREELLARADDMLTATSDALTATRELFTFITRHRTSLGYQNPPVFDSYEESLANYEEQVSNQKSTIQGTRALVEAARAILRGEAPQASSPESAALDIQRAELALEEARARLLAHEVRAPFSGVIARVDKRASQYAGDGESVALLISNTHMVRVYLAQGEAARIKVGTRVLVSIEGSDVSVPGIVEEMDGRGEKNEDGDIVFSAVITFPKPDERLKPGMQVRVSFEADAPSQ